MVKSQTQIQGLIKEFIHRSIGIETIKENDDLFESGIVNSLFAIRLMTFLEKTFGIEVAEADLDIQNFKSVAAASAFVGRKLTSSETCVSPR